VPPLSATNSFVVTVTEPEFRITLFIVTNGVAEITWNSVAGQTYRLEYTDNLGGGQWTAVLPDVTASGLTASLTNAVGTSPQRFYRVQLVPLIAAPVIQSLEVSNGVVNITWTAVAGHSYRLQYKDSLSAPTWSDLLPDIPATLPTITVTSAIGSSPQRFYRVFVSQ
jgi:hypothetical protein